MVQRGTRRLDESTDLPRRGPRPSVAVPCPPRSLVRVIATIFTDPGQNLSEPLACIVTAITRSTQVLYIRCINVKQ